MLRRIVKEATGGFSSGGERATSKKKPLRRVPASEASGSSQDESNQREKKATRRKKDADDTNDDTPAEKEKPARSDKSKRLMKAGRKKREPLLDYEIMEAVYSAMHGKKKKHVRQQLLTLFTSYDPDDTGKTNEERFKKSIIKVGVQLKKSGDYDALMRCFRGPSGGDGDDTASDTGRGRKGAKKDGNAVDYMAFIDFACNVRDSEKLSAIAANLREVIDKYNDKHDRATTTPYNVYTDLRKLDKSKKDWIPSDTFIEYLEEHEKPRFRLGTSDITTLVERFEYDYGKKELGVDYKQFAQWLQPMLHLDKMALHARVKQLVAAAQDVGGWELDEMFEAMDDDGDGQVSGEELKEALIQMGLPLTDAQIRCLVEDYDTSGDGKIQYEEFTTLFAPPSKPKSRSTTKAKGEANSAEHLQLGYIKGICSEACLKGCETGSDTDDSSSGTRSDAEYNKHLKKSLRRAFDFFDLNRSSTIEKRELSHVLRALGHEFTNEELDKEMERTDLDRNGELDFHEFVRFVKRQLAQKSFLLSKQRETEIRQAFQSLDTDKNGYLDEKEFEYLVYKVLQVELSVEEQDALLDFVDTNGDGHINADEFIAFMKAMETFHKQGVMSKKKQRHMLENLDGISRLGCSAMKKLLRGAPMDLDKNLLMFFGIPTNFRPAITSFTASRALRVNTMQHVLSLPYPEAIVALGQDPLNSVELKKESSSLLGLGRKEDVSDEAILLKQAENRQAQAIVSLKRATGIPKPFDTREQDVVKRCVHVCLYQEQDPLEQHRTRVKTNGISRKQVPKSSSTALGGTVVGNILEIPVYWIPQEEDVWEFSKKTTKESKYKFLVRTNTMNDHLYLLVEFIVHLRLSDKDTSKRKKRSRRHRRASKDNDGIVTDKDGNEVREMVCSWCKIPVRTLLAKRFDPYRSQEKLWGGTARAPVDIEHDEILRRRAGWRAITNAFKKPTPPGMGIKSVPIETLGEDIQGYVRRMPPLIIAPFISLPILTDYMIAMQESLTALYKNDSASLCEPILRILPKIIDDHEALSIFRRAFDAEMANTKTLGDRQQRFRDLVLRMWPSFLELLDRIPPSVLETAVAKTGPPRRLSLLSPTSASNPPKPSQGTGGPPPPEQQERANLLQTTAQGKLRIRDVPSPAAPFHVREVAFERLI
ncbi:hypothetical protein Poli38472_003971 [Pythium oligandrum]|uniref:EF-hand domain-containing protein n=1 Tax=Pythium oligandrum TaxID=41045 RepID=A0A8K1CP61_PYTOL|nr:hypothetical protein Poli38472_003971 [Pythium oligandrum]|eukprot:TMW66206.1 hypothetical protein Poli38472_003971 [Pythium oligandrum]